MRNQNIYIICSYNIDLTRNAGNCSKCLKINHYKIIFIFSELFYKLVIVFIIEFYSGYRPGSQKLSLSICAHFLHSVIEMGQVLVLELMSPVFKIIFFLPLWYTFWVFIILDVVDRGEEGQPHQSLVRTTSKSSSFQY